MNASLYVTFVLHLMVSGLLLMASGLLLMVCCFHGFDRLQLSQFWPSFLPAASPLIAPLSSKPPPEAPLNNNAHKRRTVKL